MIKLHVMSKGDPSVGIPETCYTVQTPIREDSYEEERSEFKKAIVNLYSGFVLEKLVGIYDYEIAAVNGSDEQIEDIEYEEEEDWESEDWYGEDEEEEDEE